MRSKIVSRDSLNQIGKKIKLHDLIEIRENIAIKHSSILGNAFEAVVGALYLDLGYKKTKDFIVERIIKQHVDIANLETKKVNFKSFLLEWAQKAKKQLRYEVIEISKENETPKYQATVYLENEKFESGIGRSKKKAEQKAAEKTSKISLNLIN